MNKYSPMPQNDPNLNRELFEISHSINEIVDEVEMGGGSGTVTDVSVVSANGVSGSVTNSTTTPAITLTLGAITPSSVTASGTVTGSNLSGTNTGDQDLSGYELKSNYTKSFLFGGM